MRLRSLSEAECYLRCYGAREAAVERVEPLVGPVAWRAFGLLLGDAGSAADAERARGLTAPGRVEPPRGGLTPAAA